MPEVNKFSIGDRVRIKSGASKWMKSHRYWSSEWPNSIDGMIGEIKNDYTYFSGNDSHYEVDIKGIDGCGVNPMWLDADPSRLVSIADESVMWFRYRGKAYFKVKFDKGVWCCIDPFDSDRSTAEIELFSDTLVEPVDVKIVRRD
jgi:hypothetical protein